MENDVRISRGTSFKIAAMFMIAIMLWVTVSPPFIHTAHASPRYTGVVSSAAITTQGNVTQLTFVTNQRLTFSFSYTRDAISIRINRASSFPSTVSMGANSLFTSGQWNGDTLTLTLANRDGFMGYWGFFDSNDNTVVRFRNPPSSIAAARIAIDPGHGGLDRGAEGFRRDMPEAVINRQMANLLAEELRRRGATVLVLDTAGGMELRERVRQAEEFNADMFISIHNNASARNPAARGTEVFFYTPFSSVLAATASRDVSARFDTLNRRSGRRRFTVLTSTRFASVLVEVGFVTNRAEYEKLINPVYQQRAMAGLASAIAVSITHAHSGRPN